ncbi:hypothetical protein C0995_013583 [Termitomyces sp. Mi166|nr:hypothetical protein C0995_013583 [Termitomyces sp. Mi166\
MPLAEFVDAVGGTTEVLDPTNGRCMPPLGLMKGEEEVAEYLNDIVITFNRYRRRRTQRNHRELIGYWSAGRYNKILPIGPYQAKPNVILVPVQDGRQVPVDKLAWPDVLCVGEKTRTKCNTCSIRDTSVARAYLMLYMQGDRDNVTTFAMNGQSFFVYIADRECVISIGPMFYETHTNEFLALILSLSFLCQGYDETMTRKPNIIPENAPPFPPQTAPSQLTFNWKDSGVGGSSSQPADAFPPQQTAPSQSMFDWKRSTSLTGGPSSTGINLPPPAASRRPSLTAMNFPPPTASRRPSVTGINLFPPSTHHSSYFSSMAGSPALDNPPLSTASRYPLMPGSPASGSSSSLPSLRQQPAALITSLESMSGSPVSNIHSHSSLPLAPHHSLSMSDFSASVPPNPKIPASIRSNGSSNGGLKRKINEASDDNHSAGLKSNTMCNIKTINCNGKVYTIIREVFRSRTFAGRATRVWEALDEHGDAVIIKESWILQGRKQSEASMIKNARAPQIPKIVDHMTLEYSTGTHRQRLQPDQLKTKHREKRRVVEKPVGSSLSTIRSYLELLSAFLDYVKGIKYLREHNRMHRDISATNLMLYHADFEEPTDKRSRSVIQILRKAGCRRGLLIDFDYASFINPDILDPLATSLPIQEDLVTDSLSFGPLTAAISPAQDLMKIDDFGVRTKPDDQKFHAMTLIKPLFSWFLPQIDLETLGKIKTAQFHNYFEKRILSHVKPLFSSLVPTLKRIWDALYPMLKTAEDPPEDCCDDFIDALEDVILNMPKSLEDVETMGQTMPEEDTVEATRDYV